MTNCVTAGCSNIPLTDCVQQVFKSYKWKCSVIWKSNSIITRNTCEWITQMGYLDTRQIGSKSVILTNQPWATGRLSAVMQRPVPHRLYKSKESYDDVVTFATTPAVETAATGQSWHVRYWKLNNYRAVLKNERNWVKIILFQGFPSQDCTINRK